MSRVLDPDLQALIDAAALQLANYETHTAIVLTLGDGSAVLYFSTALETVGANVFQAELDESDPLKMSLDGLAFDSQGLKVQNVSQVFGQQLTSASEALEGATAVLAMIFKDVDTDEVFYDEKMPGDVMAGAVSQNVAELPFVAEIYAAQVVTDTIASVFPYQNAPAIAPVLGDPNDLLDPNNLPGVGGIRFGGGRLPTDPGFGFDFVGGLMN